MGLMSITVWPVKRIDGVVHEANDYIEWKELRTYHLAQECGTDASVKVLFVSCGHTRNHGRPWSCDMPSVVNGQC